MRLEAIRVGDEQIAAARESRQDRECEPGLAAVELEHVIVGVRQAAEARGRHADRLPVADGAAHSGERLVILGTEGLDLVAPGEQAPGVAQCDVARAERFVERRVAERQDAQAVDSRREGGRA